jgi:hypothetical protein
VAAAPATGDNSQPGVAIRPEPAMPIQDAAGPATQPTAAGKPVTLTPAAPAPAAQANSQPGVAGDAARPAPAIGEEPEVALTKPGSVEAVKPVPLIGQPNTAEQDAADQQKAAQAMKQAAALWQPGQ